MTQNHHFRLFDPTRAEYEAIVRVFNRANPHDAGSASAWRHWDQHRDPARVFTRYVAESAGEIGGYGFSVRTDLLANKFRIAAYFLPQWETAGLIDKFYRYITGRIIHFAPTALLCQAREDEAAKTAWLKQQGFQQVMRYPRSVLMLDDFDAGPYSGLRARIAAQGLEILSLTELAEREPVWQRKVYELNTLLSQDVPMPTTFVPTPFEQYVQREFEDPDSLPQLWLFALDGDALVGMTSLYKSGADLDMLETDLTGVHRDYRRRGLATALKVQALELAQRMGARQVQTSNEENNPMYDLNLRLGFQPQPADVDWQKVEPFEGIAGA